MSKTSPWQREKKIIDTVYRREFLSLIVALLCSPSAGSVWASEQSQKHLSDHLLDHFFCADLITGKTEGAHPEQERGKPGSIMKLILAAAMVECRLPAVNQVVVCNGTTQMGAEHFSCRAKHGRVDLTQAIGYSCNVFFAHTAGQISPDILHEFLSRFDLLSHTRFPKHFEQQHQLDLALGLSDSIQFDAREMLHLMTQIATRGHSFASPETITLGTTTWNVLQEGMRLAVRRGSARRLDAQDRLQIAAKTGTSVHGDNFQSWIAGYFPYDRPRHVFCLRATSGTSWDSAIPQARAALFARTWS